MNKPKAEDSKLEVQGMLLDNNIISKSSRQDELPTFEEISDKISDIPGLGELTPEAQQYIIKLQSRLASAKKVIIAHFNYQSLAI